MTNGERMSIDTAFMKEILLKTAMDPGWYARYWRKYQYHRANRYPESKDMVCYWLESEWIQKSKDTDDWKPSDWDMH